ncbi:MAG: cell surface protein required for swimming motility, partial [Cyanobacteriota bacterium]
MDPLEKRYDDQLEPQVHPSTDGGDLNAGQQPNTQSFWQDNGLASDLNRTLERVQQQEAWLQSQSQPQWLHGANNGTTPLSSGANGAGSGQALLVVDTSRADWQQRVNQLGNQADVLLIHPHQHGLEMVRDALNGNPYGRIELLVRDHGEAGLALGTDPITGADAAADRLRSNLGLGGQVALQLDAASAPPAVATTLLGDARGLVDLARTSLGIAKEHGRLEAAVASAYSADNQVAVLAAANAFLNGQLAPTIQWASFERSNIRGAYVQERNTILISNTLQSAAEPILQSVLLEELGHWLEASTAQLADSPGDEGEGFAEMLLRGNTDGLGHSQNNQDQILLEIDGQVMGAELASVISAASGLTGNTISVLFDESMQFGGGTDSNNYLLDRLTLRRNGVDQQGRSAFSGYQFSLGSSGNSLNLFLITPLAVGDTATLTYTDYSQTNDSWEVVENSSGTDLSTTVIAVTNNSSSSGSGANSSSTPPTTNSGGAPYLVSTTAAYDNGLLRVSVPFSEPLAITGSNATINPALFGVSLGSGAATGISVVGVSINGSTVNLTVSGPLTGGDYRINYTPPTSPSDGRLEDADGNDVGSFILNIYTGASSGGQSNVPSAANWSASTSEDTTLSFSAGQFTAGFSDPELDSLASITITALPTITAGLLKFMGSNVSANQVVLASQLSQLSFVPTANF